ncbi:asparaginase-domain-containing protein [Gloeophyllum trabeum ATCC 11539]|uniref:asparaginase n=1 Tax=Gloeophyllum trabeum (strain ATCC 11539 / FP-39264 / Madison 617) TaxID=670483 RepID=S7QDQ3_GLOTA|nr:asparaginase-domain-containing protein [Gloeophyllum trabeum ATCC 11539]EPQ57971.1 asparaginase-domain-containing protein [Gloeophyllum trabeum ATCC 11539]
MELSQPSDESKVLMIYTGGTIGMLVGQQGYVPEPYFLTETLRNQSRFHDPLEDSLFSHSSTAHLPCLVTPRTTASGQRGSKRIRYAILEWNPLLDSSNIEISDWIRIATEIELNYNTFDAFVVLHGTDTMSYTSSALSFLLEDLGKTVILTGAQIPLSQLRNDAVDNLLGALVIAGNYIIPECCLYFNHTLFRGNRVSKVSSYDFNAFHSPNFPALVNVGIDIVVNWNDVIRQTSLRRFKAHKGAHRFHPPLPTLRLFPGITASTIRAFLAPPVQGVVLETFGAGNAPQRQDLMSELKAACDRGVIIIAITQCVKGSVGDAYETGRTLLKSGVVPGGDMTPECALAKLSYLLSKPELSVSEVRDLVMSPLRGEITRNRSSPTAPSAVTADETIGSNLQNISGIISQIVRLSSTTPGLPLITAAPSPPVMGSTGAGVVNSLEPGSGRSPLHTAALNGAAECISKLLEAGALVHLRDSLGHTALYYAARQGHENIVDILMKAGANLGGSDVEGGFVELAVQKARRTRDERALAIWQKASGFK